MILYGEQKVVIKILNVLLKKGQFWHKKNLIWNLNFNHLKILMNKLKKIIFLKFHHKKLFMFLI